MSGSTPARLPDGITEKAAQKLAATLVEKALVRKIRAKPDMPVRGTPSTRSMRRERPVRPPSPALSVDEISELASQICQCPIA
jgi:hypothetical protein